MNYNQIYWKYSFTLYVCIHLQESIFYSYCLMTNSPREILDFSPKVPDFENLNMANLNKN